MPPMLRTIRATWLMERKLYKSQTDPLLGLPTEGKASGSERSTGSGVFYGTRFCPISRRIPRRMAGARAF